MKNRKNKKRNMLKGLRPALENVVLYSAHCFDEMQVKGIRSPAVHKAIFNQNHSWQIMLLTFCVDGNGKKYSDMFIPDIPVCNSKEAQLICDPISEKMISKLNPKHFICSGWYAVLSDKIDLNVMLPDIKEMFYAAGAFDRNICNLAWSMRPESEK
tara:strand:- start:6746 stop:7213 length:468 start_codon:yes stop_codon:yes gene_type:complete